MPTEEWLKQAFAYGYDSGEITSEAPDAVRAAEERAIGGSYYDVFLKGIVPFLRRDSHVLELGPGRGSWTRAMLSCIPDGVLHTVDFLDVTPWLRPEQCGGRLICHTVHDNSFRDLPEGYFDFFWSFGVLCHNDPEHIAEILRNSLPRVKPGAIAVHQYGDWPKLDVYGWERFGMPPNFNAMPDDEIWWPRNSKEAMARLAEECGWVVIAGDLGLLKRDSIIVLQRSA